MRIVLVITAAFITFVTTLPASAQTPGNQNFVLKDGQWMVCNYADCKPLTERTCHANHEARVMALLTEGQRIEASLVPGWSSAALITSVPAPI